MDRGLCVQIVVVSAVLAVLWVVPDLAAHRRRLVRLGRRFGLVRPEPPVPSGPAVERISSDARRIREAIRSAPVGSPEARIRGWWEAYDDVLIAACLALGLDQRLSTMPAGTERELERERVERMLIRAGLLDLPGR